VQEKENVCTLNAKNVCSVCVENDTDLASNDICLENDLVCEHLTKKPNKNKCQYCLPNNSTSTMPIKIVDKQKNDLKSKVVRGNGIRTVIAGIPMITKSNKKSRQRSDIKYKQ